MVAQITTNTRVQVSFTVTDPERNDGISFTDALYYPVGQVPAAAVVRADGLARYQAWRVALESRPPRPPKSERIKALADQRDAAISQAAQAEMALLAEQNSQEV